MNLAVFDLETNGYAGFSVLSASSIVLDEAGRMLAFFNRFYLPTEAFNPYLFRIHGLTPQRLLALREHIPSAPHFIEDWPDLMEFWEHWDVEGIVVHNVRFDLAFLPELAQSSLRCWCSMLGLTELCALPKRPGSRGGGAYKWPRLQEAADVVCNGPRALTPPEATRQAESAVGECRAHVSLADCFELYRISARILAHHPELICFAPVLLPFRMPKAATGEIKARPRHDGFTAGLLELEARLRGYSDPSISYLERP